MTDLPLTPIGKVDRRALQGTGQDQAMQEHTIEDQPSQTER